MNAHDGYSRVVIDDSGSATSEPKIPDNYELFELSSKVILDKRIGMYHFQYIERSAIAIPKTR